MRSTKTAYSRRPHHSSLITPRRHTPMEPFIRHSGRFVTLDRANVDTDQIIPARYLKRIERTGYGDFLMEDIAQKDGQPDPSFILNRPEANGATILVARQNF